MNVDTSKVFKNDRIPLGLHGDHHQQHLNPADNNQQLSPLRHQIWSEFMINITFHMPLLRFLHDI